MDFRAGSSPVARTNENESLRYTKGSEVFCVIAIKLKEVENSVLESIVFRSEKGRKSKKASSGAEKA